MQEFILSAATGESLYRDRITGALQWEDGAPVADGKYPYVKGFSWNKGEQSALRKSAERHPAYQPLLEKALACDGTPDYAYQTVKNGGLA